MLFLLYTLVQINPALNSAPNTSHSFSIYLRSLPIPTLPTTYSDRQLAYFTSTSLTGPITGKKHALHRDFTTASQIPLFKNVTQQDYTTLDALIRSRSLEHPHLSEILVPLLDYVNHSPDPNCRYDISPQGTITLLPLRPLRQGEELTISYGSGKSPLEMLFSYGFLPESSPTVHPTRLRLRAPGMVPWDRMAGRKMQLLAYREAAPVVEIARAEEWPYAVEWRSDMVWLSVLGEDDGLEIKLPEEDSAVEEPTCCFGGRVVDELSDLRGLLELDEQGRWDVQRCLATMTVEPVVEAEIERRKEASALRNTSAAETTSGDDGVREMAKRLEKQEGELLSELWASLLRTEEELLSLDVVAEHFAKMAAAAEKDGS
jgi:hypothetical protein